MYESPSKPTTSTSLGEPSPGTEVMEDHEVAPARAHNLPVAAAQRSAGPPAVLDQTRLAHLLDRLAINRARDAADAHLHAHGARQVERQAPTHPGKGVN